MDLARFQGQGPVPIGDISSRQGVSVKYLEQLVRPLKKAGLVESVRGPKGGHLLAIRPEEITIGQIVKLFETQKDLVECISFPHKCHLSADCRLRMVWEEASEALYEKLDSTTIADLIV